ncbi:hypothetical protein PG984_006021 [Apiospora sp. TS-2023a]
MQQPPGRRPARDFRCARATSHGVSSSPIGYPQAPHLNSLSGRSIQQQQQQQQQQASKQAAGSGGQPSFEEISWPGRPPRMCLRIFAQGRAARASWTPRGGTQPEQQVAGCACAISLAPLSLVEPSPMGLLQTCR